MAPPTTYQARKPTVSLDAATANGNGGGSNVSGYRTIAMQTSHTGTPTAGTVTLELSLDGDTWFASSTVFTIGTTANDSIQWAVDEPAAYARAVLAGLTGGTAPTVTALISGA